MQCWVVQSATCLAADTCLTAEPEVASSIHARFPSFMEINHEIISTTILRPLIQEGLLSVTTKNWLIA